jgi:hypothetical protein
MIRKEWAEPAKVANALGLVIRSQSQKLAWAKVVAAQVSPRPPRHCHLAILGIAWRSSRKPTASRRLRSASASSSTVIILAERGGAKLRFSTGGGGTAEVGAHVPFYSLQQLRNSQQQPIARQRERRAKSKEFHGSGSGNGGF